MIPLYIGTVQYSTKPQKEQLESASLNININGDSKSVILKLKPVKLVVPGLMSPVSSKNSQRVKRVHDLQLRDPQGLESLEDKLV